MKKLYTFLTAVIIATSTYAQAPDKLSYQAVVRDSGDALVTNQVVGMQISVLKTTANGTAVYTETQTPTTNINGLVTLEIGTGITTDDFSTIDWSTGPYFIKTETDPTGGSSYSITGTSQLLSVPYALYAKTSGSGNYAGTSSTNLNWSQLESDCGFSVFGCNGTSIATFTTNESLSYTAGTRVRVTSASEINTFFEGTVQTYSSLVMSVLIDQITYNSGPTNDWVINLGSGGIGVPGMKGDNGQTAAECFDYTFDSSTSTSPFDGALRFNSTDLSTATQIYIHNNDNNAFNQSDYYNLISNNSSTIIGTIMVSQDDFGTNNWSLFAINNVTDNVGYQTLNVSYLSGVTTPFTDFNPIAVCFGRTGDKGDSGGVSALNSLRLSYLQANHIDIGKDLESSLVANIDATSTSLSITYPSNGFPSQPGILIVGDEQIYYQFYSSSGVYNFANVIRGYNGTTATNHNAGDLVYSTDGKIVLNEDGTMKVQELSIGNFSYPTDEGFPNQVLTTNGFDQASWSDLNTSTVSEGSNLYYTDTRVDSRITTQAGNANGLATLDGTAKIPTSQIPALVITSVSVVADISARDALTTQEGDFVKVLNADGSGNPSTYIYDGSAYVEIQVLSDVTSVAGKQGAVTLDSDDVTEGSNLYYTEARVDASTNVTANTTHRSDTSNPHSVTKTQIGLSNVENLKLNLTATTVPTATDDSSAGYSVGSRWIDVVNDKEYVCVDGSVGVAVWNETTSAEQVTAGTGLTKTGNTIDVVGSTTIIANANSLEVNSSNTANQVLLSSGSLGTAGTFGALPIWDSNAVSGILSISNGGTNSSSFSAGNRIIATNSGNTALEATSIDPSSLLTTSGVQTLTNKTLDATTYFADNIDNSKKVQLDLSSITTGTTRVLTVPDSNTIMVGTSTPQTLTNKTLTSTTNNIAANSLHSTTTTIDVSSSTAPTPGQVLTAISGTSATWQSPSAPNLVNYSNSSTSMSTTTANTYITLNSMTNTPPSGTYMVSFSSSGTSSSGSSESNYAIFVDGTIIAESERRLGVTGGTATNNYYVSLHTQAIVTVNGAQSISIRHRTSTGTFEISSRNMILLKLN